MGRQREFVVYQAWSLEESSFNEATDILNAIDDLVARGVSITRDEFLSVFCPNGKSRRVEEFYSLQAKILNYIENLERDPSLITSDLLHKNGHLTFPAERQRQERNAVFLEKEKRGGRNLFRQGRRF